MKRLVAIMLFLVLNSTATFSDESRLRGLLQISDQYIYALVQKVNTIITTNSSSSFPGQNILVSSDGSDIINPFFETLAISSDYKIKIQFKAITNTAMNSSVNKEFEGKRILLIPIIESQEISNNLGQVISSWQCVTDIDNFTNHLVGVRKESNWISPVGIVSDNKYLNDCIGVSINYLDDIW
ncbi:MAG: hypothetical protein K9G11_02240 [Rickettsiaceae bacterium]|nr:hypothetical protein [Rickettsiaceae bacterium]